MFNEIKIPQLGVNDKMAELVKWYVQEKEKVKKGDPICCLETTKVTIDLEAEYTGYIRIIRKEKEKVPIQGVIGYIADSPLEKVPRLEIQKEKGKKATKKAIKLAEKLGIDLEHIKKRGIIREKDVYDLNQRNT